MSEKNRRAQRIDDFLGRLLIVAAVLGILYFVFGPSSRPSAVVATHPAEVSQLDQAGDAAFLRQTRAAIQNPTVKAGIEG